MSDEWLNKIHDRMSDYEVGEPDELWASIEAAQGSDIRRKCILVWVRRSVAVAAMLVAVISTAVYLMRDDIALPKLAAPEMISYRPTVPGPGNLPLTKVSSDRAVGNLIRHDKAVGLSGVVRLSYIIVEIMVAVFLCLCTHRAVRALCLITSRVITRF